MDKTIKEFKTNQSQLEDMFEHLQNGYHFSEVSNNGNYLTVWLFHNEDKELYKCFDMELMKEEEK